MSTSGDKVDLCVATSCRQDIQCLDGLLYSFQRNAPIQDINLIVSLNTTSDRLRGRIESIVSDYAFASSEIFTFQALESIDSCQHGESLNNLVEKTTSNKVIFADADTIVLPGWFEFCSDHIDRDFFMVGTSYHKWMKSMWQKIFPNVWCSMVDGKELRRAQLDMRPTGVTKVGGKWVLPGKNKKDCGWRLAAHAYDNNLPYKSFGNAYSKLPVFPRSFPKSPISKYWIRENPWEFVFPGTDVLSCVHLCHAVSQLGRSLRWACIVRDAVDLISER